MAGQPSIPRPEAGAVEGARRQVTVLFADMVGFTAAAERLGEERTFTLVQTLVKLLSEEIHAAHGTVQELTGDGVMALFGAPAAHEDAPLQACRAACAIQERVRAAAPALEAEYGVAPAFRVGLNSGALIVGRLGDDRRMEFTAIGDTVNLAARLQALAEPGEILISEATRALVEGRVESTDLGRRSVKGKAEAQLVHRLDALNEDVSRFDVAVHRGLGAFVERERELGALMAEWEAARAGATRVATVIGEPGLGKSRLLYEFGRRLAERDALLLEGTCPNDARARPFYPFIEIARAALRIDARTAPGEADLRLRRGLETLGLAAEPMLPYLRNLLGYRDDAEALAGLDDEVVGLRTREALLSFIAARCRLAPLALVLDDVHWIDTASEELLPRIAALEATLPLLLVCAFRPDYAPGWAGAEAARPIRLGPLSEDGAAALVHDALGGGDMPDALARQVFARAEGNPLYTEELLRYLCQADRGAAASGLPASLANILMDRIDHLDADLRRVIEIAAVVGQSVPAALVGRIAGPKTDAEKALSALADQGLLRREGGRGEYRFNHALNREAVYDSLLTGRRRSLHLAVAEAIEAAGDLDGEALDALAFHYSRSDRAGKAAHYLARSGRRSLAVYSLHEAEASFRAAIDLLDGDAAADRRALIDTLLDLLRVLYFQADFGGIIALTDRYLPLAEALGDASKLSRFLFEAGYARVFSDQPEQGRALLERALAVGTDAGDDEAIGYASLGLGWHAVNWCAELSERRVLTRRHFGRAEEIGRRLRDFWLASKAVMGGVFEGTLYGRPGEAREAGLRLLELARETNDPRPRAMGLWGLGLVDAFSFEFEGAVANAEESLRIALSPIDRLSAQSVKGAALVMSGQAGEGAPMVAYVTAESKRRGFTMQQMMLEGIGGVSTALGGRLAAGIDELESVIDCTEALGYGAVQRAATGYLGEVYLGLAGAGERPSGAVLRRNFGFLLRTLPFARRRARRAFETARALAERQDAPAEIGAALFGLGRLAALSRKRDRARSLFDDARRFAAEGGADRLVARIDAAAAAL